jgi:hypothetical protein
VTITCRQVSFLIEIPPQNLREFVDEASSGNTGKRGLRPGMSFCNVRTENVSTNLSNPSRMGEFQLIKFLDGEFATSCIPLSDAPMGGVILIATTRPCVRMILAQLLDYRNSGFHPGHWTQIYVWCTSATRLCSYSQLSFPSSIRSPAVMTNICSACLSRLNIGERVWVNPCRHAIHSDVGACGMFAILNRNNRM